MTEPAASQNNVVDASIFGPHKLTQLLVAVATGISCTLFWIAARILHVPREPGFGPSLVQSPGGWAAASSRQYCSFWDAGGLPIASSRGGGLWRGCLQPRLDCRFGRADQGRCSISCFRPTTPAPAPSSSFISCWNCWCCSSQSSRSGSCFGIANLACNSVSPRLGAILTPRAKAAPTAPQSWRRSELPRLSFTFRWARLRPKSRSWCQCSWRAWPARRWRNGSLPRATVWRWYWIAPLLVGVAGYFLAWHQAAGMEIGHLSGTFAPLSRALPLDLAGMGCAGALAGHWFNSSEMDHIDVEDVAQSNGEPRPR